jgi:hypothetical protein
VAGTATSPGGARHNYLAHFTDNGEVVTLQLP